MATLGSPPPGLAATRPRQSARPRRLSWEQFLEWLPDDVRAEWVDGEVVYLSPVADPHARISVFLCALLQFFVEAHDLGVVRIAPFLMKTGTRLGGREPRHPLPGA